MHILIGLLTALGVVALIAWRVHVAIQTARALHRAAGEAGRFIKRKRRAQRGCAGAADEPDDPRDAAAAMLVALAQSDGAMTAAEQRVILDRMTAAFAVDEKQVREVLARGRWLAHDTGHRDLHSFLKRMTPPIAQACTRAEQADLIAMLEAVAEAEGPADLVAREAIAFVGRQLGLGPGGRP